MGRGQRIDQLAAADNNLPSTSTLALPAEIEAPEQTIPGVDAAAAHVAAAVRDGKHIAVFCDYDPDGTCAGESLRLALAPHVREVGYRAEDKSQLLFGFANARKGFGLDVDFVNTAAEAGATTLITVDCGSASTDAVARARELGMTVVVSDHHQIATDNPADFHLNPALHGSSDASGAVVAWKLALSLASELTGHAAGGELLTRGAYVASFGARSDWMDMQTPENSALLAFARKHGDVPPGLRRLARRLDLSDCESEESFKALDDVLNLPKRTPRADAQWAAAVWAAKSEAEADEAVGNLLAVNALSVHVLSEMQASARERLVDDGRRVPYARVRVAAVEDFTGHAGNVAHELNELTGRPALALLYAGRDGHGHELWRWAARNNVGNNVDQSFTEALGEIRAASTVVEKSPDGQLRQVASAGGHPRAVSGRCTDDRVKELVAAFEAWACSRTHWAEPAPPNPS
jgi:single-stranded-DNA-specific exonuclease